MIENWLEYLYKIQVEDEDGNVVMEFDVAPENISFDHDVAGGDVHGIVNNRITTMRIRNQGEIFRTQARNQLDDV